MIKFVEVVLIFVMLKVCLVGIVGVLWIEWMILFVRLLLFLFGIEFWFVDSVVFSFCVFVLFFMVNSFVIFVLIL